MRLPFEENGSSKIGVRFDKPIPGGIDLGGSCEIDHGFFCQGDFLPSVVLNYTYYFLTTLMFALYFYILLISVTDDLCLFVFQLILCASMVQDGKIELNSHLM